MLKELTKKVADQQLIWRVINGLETSEGKVISEALQEATEPKPESLTNEGNFRKAIDYVDIGADF